ncbi:MAG TPA: hypothetical protein V6D08_13645 [Candidatus Obscuribacterales bacterium]
MQQNIPQQAPQEMPGQPTPIQPGALRRVVQKINPIVSRTINRLRQPFIAQPGAQAGAQQAPHSTPPQHVASYSVPPQGQGAVPSGTAPPQVGAQTVHGAVAHGTAVQPVQPVQPVVPSKAAPQPAAPPPRGFMPPPPSPEVVPSRGDAPPRPVQKLNPVLARTKIDFEACKQIVSRMVSDQEVKVKEELKTRPVEPFKPEQPIEAYRYATACGSEWNYMSGSDRFRVCSLCKCHVYDFKNMTIDEVITLVHQREGIEDPCFYMRSDGRFLTRDCPVGVARGRKMLALIAGSVLIFVGVIALSMAMPRRPEPAVSQVARPKAKPKTTEVTVKKETEPVAGAVLQNQSPADGQSGAGAGENAFGASPMDVPPDVASPGSENEPAAGEVLEPPQTGAMPGEYSGAGEPESVQPGEGMTPGAQGGAPYSGAYQAAPAAPAGNTNLPAASSSMPASVAPAPPMVPAPEPGGLTQPADSQIQSAPYVKTYDWKR